MDPKSNRMYMLSYTLGDGKATYCVTTCRTRATEARVWTVQKQERILLDAQGDSGTEMGLLGAGILKEIRAGIIAQK